MGFLWRRLGLPAHSRPGPVVGRVPILAKDPSSPSTSSCHTLIKASIFFIVFFAYTISWYLIVGSHYKITDGGALSGVRDGTRPRVSSTGAGLPVPRMEPERSVRQGPVSESDERS